MCFGSDALLKWIPNYIYTLGPYKLLHNGGRSLVLPLATFVLSPSIIYMHFIFVLSASIVSSIRESSLPAELTSHLRKLPAHVVETLVR